MAGSLYTGNMGAGKTYGATRFGIVPALKRGQRVVTNIPVNVEKLTDYLGFNIDGLLVVVTNEQVEAPGFWYSDACPNAIVQPGDMVIIDEAWQFFGSDKKLKSDHPAFEYLRLHRKYTHPESGFASEVWYVTQDYNDISRSFRSVCDFHLFMEKLKVVGKPDEFRVDYFANCRVAPNRQQPFKQQFYKYDPVFFDLYHSYAASSTSISDDKAEGVEVQADDRMNYWNQKVLFGLLGLKQAMWLAYAVAALGIGFLLYYFASLYLHRNDPTFLTKSVIPGSVSSAPGLPVAAPASASAASVPPPGTPGAAAAPAPSERAGESSEYRLVGLYRFNGRPMAVVADTKGAYRYLSPFEFEELWTGPVHYIKYKDKVIAPWTGPQPSFSQTQKMETSK